MRSFVLLVVVALAGCKVCVGACKKDQGRAVTAVVPNADGTMQVTTCALTTKGTDSKLGDCRDVVLPSADGTAHGQGSSSAPGGGTVGTPSRK